jgi:hypothetical protein
VELSKSPHEPREAVVHRNAPLTPEGRLRFCQRIVDSWTLAAAADSMNISRQCAHKWWRRFQDLGAGGLEDRSIHRIGSPTIDGTGACDAVCKGRTERTTMETLMTTPNKRDLYEHLAVPVSPFDDELPSRTTATFVRGETTDESEPLYSEILDIRTTFTKVRGETTDESVDWDSLNVQAERTLVTRSDRETTDDGSMTDIVDW